MKFSGDTWLILAGILLGSVLAIENMVVGMIGYLFLDPSANTGIIVFVATGIGIGIGYGIRGNTSKSKGFDEENEYDF